MADVLDFARSVQGLAVLVTGAGDGMGLATAVLFARDGARVAVTDIRLDRAAAVVLAIEAEGHSAKAWALDVGDADAINRVVTDVAAWAGGLDIVINNAGIAHFATIDDADYQAVWDRHLSVLLTAHQHVIRASLPWLKLSAHPRIVNIASTEALGGTAGNSSYSAAKAGVVGLTRGLAVELGRDGITVNCICPGPIETSMTQAIPEDQKRVYARRRTALGRYGTPEEVAHITLSVCLPASSYLTGTVIPVDGGLTARNG